jgi:mycothiol synthase
MDAQVDIVRSGDLLEFGFPAARHLGFRRPVGRGDLRAASDVFNRSLAADGVDRAVSPDDLASATADGGDVFLVEVGREVVGCLCLRWPLAEPAERTYEHAAALVPQWRRQGIGAAMLAQAHQRLREAAIRLGIRRSSHLQAEVNETQTGTLLLLLREGYVAAGYRYHMVQPDLRDVPDVPLPRGVTVRPVGVESPTLPKAGEPWEVGDGWCHLVWDGDPIRERVDSPQGSGGCRVAWDGDRVVGVAVTSIPHPENASLNRRRGIIRALAVRQTWKGTNLGRALLAHALVDIKARGMNEVSMTAIPDHAPDGARWIEGMGFRMARRSAIYRRGFPDEGGRVVPGA